MNKFKSAMKIVGKVLDTAIEDQKKINDMTDILMQKSWGVEREQAKKIARVLIQEADVTWK